MSDLINLKSPDESILICTVGLPRSGKTTWCRELAARIGAPIVCPDDIRLALHGQLYVPSAEPIIWALAKLMVRSLFISSHKTVIVDAMNLTVDRRREWNDGDALYTSIFHQLDTAMEECIARTDDPKMKTLIKEKALRFQPIQDGELEYTGLGATGKFPDGKLDEDDQGELQMAVASDPDTNIVHLKFGKPIAYIGLDRKGAIGLGKLLLEKAAEIQER